eukprot:m.101594 g.101594  ORF g.101594 m.101594 type:complete len:62 (-) comp13206_c0_seq2:68-253(-)
MCSGYLCGSFGLVDLAVAPRFARCFVRRLKGGDCALFQKVFERRKPQKYVVEKGCCSELVG